MASGVALVYILCYTAENPQMSAAIANTVCAEELDIVAMQLRATSGRYSQLLVFGICFKVSNIHDSWLINASFAVLIWFYFNPWVYINK